MGWLQRRTHQSLRIAESQGWAALEDLSERRRKPLRRFQRQVALDIKRMWNEQLLHNGGKP